uniref:Uncharacterized protein n=1 Tax=Vitrella brassicaformis TaxID=1169539 RepID=A0A7S1JVJ2_9ALVE
MHTQDRTEQNRRQKSQANTDCLFAAPLINSVTPPLPLSPSIGSLHSAQSSHTSGRFSCCCCCCRRTRHVNGDALYAATSALYVATLECVCMCEGQLVCVF